MNQRSLRMMRGWRSLYKIDKYDVDIEVDLGNGLYTFTRRSATGKSYLASMLRRYHRFGEPVNSYTYGDYLDKLELRAVTGDTCRVLVVDRYDMYYGAFLQELLELSNRCIVLVDLKGASPLYKDNLCSVLLKVGGILVS